VLAVVQCIAAARQQPGVGNGATRSKSATIGINNISDLMQRSEYSVISNYANGGASLSSNRHFQAQRRDYDGENGGL